MILKSLRRRLVRTALTILGIATGVAAVVALGALAEGIAVNYGSSLAFNSQILVTQANKFDVVFSNLDEDLGQRLLTVPDVATVEPGVFRWLTLGDVPYFLVFGYEPDSVAVKHYAVVDGKPIAGSKEIVVGRRGAEALGKLVGDTLDILGVSYRIVGIYETGQGMEESILDPNVETTEQPKLEGRGPWHSHKPRVRNSNSVAPTY